MPILSSLKIIMLKALEPGRTMGIEPTNGGITIHCLNHLATPAIHTVMYYITPNQHLNTMV